MCALLVTSADTISLLFSFCPDGWLVYNLPPPPYLLYLSLTQNTFEWTDREGIPHTPGAVIVAQYTANFFVQQTRASKHVYPFEELIADVIWNYNPVYTYLQGSSFIQKYFW